MSLDNLTWKQIQDLGNKMGGEERVKRFLSGELVLAERNVSPVPITGFDNGGITFASFDLNVEAFLDDWSKFLKEVFKTGLPSQKKIILPKTRPGFGWGVLVPRQITIEGSVGSYSDICPVWRRTNENLDKVTNSVRDANKGTYACWFRDRIEADEEYKKKSANDIKIAGINGITLLERLLLGRWFYWKTNKHLDIVSITRCDGSRHLGGNVLSVSFVRYIGELYVDNYHSDSADDGLRSREAVS